MKKLVILISNAGTGSNLQAIIQAIQSYTLQATISAVISDQDDAVGLTIAHDAHIQTSLCSKKEQLLPLLKKFDPDYIVLTGWRQFITNAVIDAYSEKILNLHPGIIPETADGISKNPDGTDALWNKQMFANTALHHVLEQNATYAGSSVHFLTHTFDYGPVLGRTFEKVEPDDTIESLYKRLKKKENKLYVKVLEKLCNA